ncbi:MAG: creatininase family protein [Puia sp.]|nr:creatininase family protein [Puia sp.]
MRYSDHHYASLNQEAEKAVILLPLGATEQHGPHLAVSTDTDIVTRIAGEAEKRLSDRVLLCPSLPFGSSDHHLSFGGTLSVSPALYTQMITELVGSLLKSGFRRIVLLNGHGGNITPVKQALALLSHQYDGKLQPNIALATYWELAGRVFSGEPPMESPALSHACEYETSLMLHLFPEKVWMDRAQRARRPSSNGYIPFEDDEPYRGVTLFKATRFISSNGSSGEPQLASAEKGRHLFDHAVTAVVQFLESFRDWPFLGDLAGQ